MELCSHLIEIRQFMDKCLVYDIQVKDISLSALGLNVKTNKWLHLEDWLELETAIQKLLAPFQHSETLDGFDTDIFHLGGSIRVACKKIKVSRAHKKILGSDKVYLPFALDIQVTKICTKTLIEQITIFEEKLKKLSQNTNGSLKEEVENSIHNENMREYDPTINNIGTEHDSNDYVPYRASVKTPNDPSSIDNSGSVITENEPYSPKPVSGVESSPDQISESPNEIPTYRPARIAQNKQTNEIVESHNDEQNEEKPRSTKLLRRKRSPAVAVKNNTSASPSRDNAVKHRPTRKVKTTNAELFGSDDSDQEQHANLDSPAISQVSDSPKRVSTPLHTSDRTERKRLKLRHESTHSSPLDKWLSKSSVKKIDKANGKLLKKSSRHAPTGEVKLEAPKKKSDEQITNQNLAESKQIKELVALRDAIKSKKKSPPPVMEILSLTHLSTKDIFGTFEAIRPILDEIFKTYSKKTKITGFNGINHMKTLMLIDDKKQLQMMNYLRENYQPEEKGVPSLTDLYINALVPEWTVNVFMKEFHFTRDEAIHRLQAQEESWVHHNNEGLDQSGPL